MLSSQVDSIDPVSVPTSSASKLREEKQELTWQVHLVRRDPRALPGLLIAVLTAACLVWLLFQNPLPALAAVALLFGSVREYLLPVTYRISSKGVESSSPGSHLELPWKEVRRCLLEAQAITLTPLPHPSRLDVFRGVTLRYALASEMGDKKQVLALLHEYLPELLQETHKEAR